MVTTSDDLLTIAETMKLLKVGRTTVHRWIRDGRLQAYHLGPHSIRLRRDEIRALLSPQGQIRPASAEPRSHATGGVFRHVSEIPPLTHEAKRRALEALERLGKHTADQLARRAGKPFPESWPLIRKDREERSRQVGG